MLPDDPDSKANACVNNVYRIWEEHADTKAAQLIFCDLSTPKNDGSQIMTRKSFVRSAEDVDEVELSFAEVKMLATGDERFKEKMDLDMQVSKLRVLKQSYLSEHYDLEDRILQKFPKLIKEYEERIAGYEADTLLAEQHKPQGDDKFCPMTLRGVTYTEKAEIEGLYEKYPKVFGVFDTEKSADLTKEECAALIEVLELKNRLTDLEMQSIYFRGCYDSAGYLKKAGIL